MNGKRIHLLFKIGVMIKGIDGAIEVLAGTVLFLTTTASLRNLVGWLTQGELQEDPTDFISTHLVAFFRHFSTSTKHFASAYLLIHGLAKVGLTAGLLRGTFWIFPAALAVLGLFLCYQAYRFAHTHSPGLGLVSLLDLVIWILIWWEYKHRKRLANPRGSTG